MRIYVDLDGTVCDLVSAVNDFRKCNNIPTQDIKYKYPWSQEGFFLSLKPISGAIESINDLSSQYDVWFLSRPSFKNLHSYTEKALWVKKHFGYEMQKKLILCGDKSLLKGRILIDDEENANQKNFDGIWIRIFDEMYPDWNCVVNKCKEIDRIGINTL